MDAAAPVTPTTADAVLDWFDRAGRNLPWRRTRDPWAVLVAETMLQQTQVSRIVERWPGFLARYPDAASFAGQPLSTAIAEWAGLGYNRRAVNLHRAAGRIERRHDNRVPDDLAMLLALPGVGPYTARAVLVFAFERDAAVLDTNVARIAARVSAAVLTRAVAQSVVDSWVPLGRAWPWNQALIDLGVLHCRPQPRCSGCPLEANCGWRRGGHRQPDPARGSAGVSGRQGRFEGSDRQGRGRLVAALLDGPVASNRTAEVMGWADDVERAERVTARLIADGLVVRRAGVLMLSGAPGVDRR